MAKQIILDNPIYQAIDGNGQPLAGGFLEPYVAGTSTPAVLYQDVNGRVPHPARIPLNARGEAVLYGNGRYKFKLLDAAGGLIHTVDDIEIVVIADWALNFLKLRTLREAVRYFGFGSAAYEDIAASILAPQPGDVLQMGLDGWYPAGDGRLITNLQPGNITGLMDLVTPRSYLAGLGLTRTGANTITIAPGWCKNAAQDGALQLTTALKKQLIDGDWTAGNNAGGLQGTGGMLTYDAWYAVYLIKNPETGDVDALFKHESHELSLPEGFTSSRRLGWVRTSANDKAAPEDEDLPKTIVDFVQKGDAFYWKSPVLDKGTGTDYHLVNEQQSLVSLRVPPEELMAIFAIGGVRHNAANLYVHSPDLNNLPPMQLDIFSAPLFNCAIYIERAPAHHGAGQTLSIYTDRFGQIAVRADRPNLEVYFCTYGWVDRRGRDD